MDERAKFGLALGGGFQHGMAHLGVLEVLERHDLTPGWIAGTSAGAIAGAFAAFGRSVEETKAALHDLGWGTMTRSRLRSRFGFASNEGLEELLLDTLGDLRIEDADVPLGIVATDINTGNRVLMERGPLARAVRASACVPGIYVPVEIDGKLLVDGALVENVPARAVREMGAPLVVAVGLGFALPYESVRSWKQVAQNAFDIAVNSQMRFEILAEADVLIDPDLDGLSKMRSKDRDEVIEAGRRRTEEALPALEDLLEKQEGSAVSRWMSAVKERLVGDRV